MNRKGSQDRQAGAGPTELWPCFEGFEVESPEFEDATGGRGNLLPVSSPGCTLWFVPSVRSVQGRANEEHG
jgi:hypothetical protein